MNNIIKLDSSDIVKALGPKLGSRFNEDAISTVNSILSTDSSLEDDFADKIVSFSSILKEGKYSTIEYIKAVQFCSYLAIGTSQIDAYRQTFPDRVAKKKTESAIQSSASIYATGSLVQKIMGQSIVPAHIMFNAERFQALGVLSKLAVNGSSERIQMEAADKLLVHTQPPKENKMVLDINHNDSNAVSDLNNALTQLAMKQKEMLDAGTISLKNIAESSIIDAEVE